MIRLTYQESSFLEEVFDSILFRCELDTDLEADINEALRLLRLLNYNDNQSKEKKFDSKKESREED